MFIEVPPATLAALVLTYLAALTDTLHRVIPNRLTYGAALLAVVLMGLPGVAPTVTAALVGFACALLVSLPLFLRGVIAGGDLKLLAALGLLIGLRIVDVMVFSLLLGLVIMLVLGIREYGWRDGIRWLLMPFQVVLYPGLQPEPSPTVTAPLALAIGIATTLVLLTPIPLLTA